MYVYFRSAADRLSVKPARKKRDIPTLRGGRQEGMEIEGRGLSSNKLLCECSTGLSSLLAKPLPLLLYWFQRVTLTPSLRSVVSLFPFASLF